MNSEVSSKSKTDKIQSEGTIPGGIATIKGSPLKYKSIGKYETTTCELANLDSAAQVFPCEKMRGLS